MRKFKLSTVILSMALALTMTVAPAQAATNVNKSVDKNGQEAYYSVHTIAPRKAEITIGLGGEYQLLPQLTKTAQEFGFSVVGNTIQLQQPSGKIVSYPITWNAEKPTYATVNSTGLINAKKICKVRPTGQYYAAVVTASIPNITYQNANGDLFRFENGIFYQNRVVVVPESDLLVYYYGVWSEDLVNVDRDAQHKNDWPIDSVNVKSQLKKMAQQSVKHCFVDPFEVLAVTKTNDGIVRTYIKTIDNKAGNHYYVVTFNSESNVNRLSVSQRDYCDTKYTDADLEYVRAK